MPNLEQKTCPLMSRLVPVEGQLGQRGVTLAAVPCVPSCGWYYWSRANPEFGECAMTAIAYDLEFGRK